MDCIVCGAPIMDEEDIGQLLCGVDCLMIWNTRKMFNVVRRDREDASQ